MVSRSILAKYYQIDLQTTGFFHYQHNDYYFSKQRDLSLYQLYINMTHFTPYYIQNNIFNQPVSQGYVLYKYLNCNLDVEKIIDNSLKIIDQRSVKLIKKGWIELMDESQKYKKNHLIYHYNFALGELAIELFNYYFPKDQKIFLGIEHQRAYPNIQYICNPDNLFVTTRIYDLSYLFLQDFLTLEQLTMIIDNKRLTQIDIMIFLCQSIFPVYFFQQVIQNQVDGRQEYQFLTNHKSHLQQLIMLFKHYIPIPDIYWL